MASGLELRRQFVAPLAKKVRLAGWAAERACFFLLCCLLLFVMAFIIYLPFPTPTGRQAAYAGFGFGNKTTHGGDITEICGIVLGSGCGWGLGVGVRLTGLLNICSSRSVLVATRRWFFIMHGMANDRGASLG